ncbi:unnamed protein product [Bemisia tabaci]|uniref:Uncharacterized protein n=1 Tax=Bemisia tabaci TaxID=7038 RepID=A0A9P0A653_BEMTA|nr:unnamed protein product [Bemisia tabaci]
MRVQRCSEPGEAGPLRRAPGPGCRCRRDAAMRHLSGRSRASTSSVAWISALISCEGTLELKKKLEEIRLLESRKSARLMDQDTDFARLADMAGDRKRSSSHSIDVPSVYG